MKSKTDKIDAQIPAQTGLERELRLWQPVSPLLRILKQLTRERDGPVRERTTVSNYLHACRHQGKPCQESIQRSGKHPVFLDKQIKETESEIRMTVRQDKTLEGKLKYPISIPGVGLLTAVTVVAETDSFVDITNVKQLAGFSGTDVKTVESGTRKGRSKISKKCNSHIRKALFMSAFSKIKKDHATNEYYNRLKQAGQTHLNFEHLYQVVLIPGSF